MMAIDTAQRTGKRLERGTDFQLHGGGSLPANVIDFTERRLLLCVERAKDPQQKLFLSALVVDYRARRCAVAWRRGRPVALRVDDGA